MNDDELERLLRESNPASTPSEVGLSANHRAILERIVAEPVGRRRSPARLTLMVTAPLAAVLAIFVVVISVFQPFAPAPAAAFGPPPLEYQPTGRSAEEAIRLAQGRLEQQQSVTEPLRQAVTTAWNLTIAEDGQAEPTVVISPSVTELEWIAGVIVMSRPATFAVPPMFMPTVFFTPLPSSQDASSKTATAGAPVALATLTTSPV